jgi:hypothetical protein
MVSLYSLSSVRELNDVVILFACCVLQTCRREKKISSLDRNLLKLGNPFVVSFFLTTVCVSIKVSEGMKLG